MARRYKNANMQRVYDMYSDPVKHGINLNFGGGLASAYRSGAARPDKVMYDRSSLAYAAWAAGADHTKAAKKAAAKAAAQ